MPYEPPPHLASLTLAQIAEQVEARKLPPVEGWAPQQDGDSNMRIAADGTWFHEGSPINRQGMVRAFSGLLIRDASADGDGAHFLVTPFEKLSIEVRMRPSSRPTWWCATRTAPPRSPSGSTPTSW